MLFGTKVKFDISKLESREWSKIAADDDWFFGVSVDKNVNVLISPNIVQKFRSMRAITVGSDDRVSCNLKTNGRRERKSHIQHIRFLFYQKFSSLVPISSLFRFTKQKPEINVKEEKKIQFHFLYSDLTHFSLGDSNKSMSEAREKKRISVYIAHMCLIGMWIKKYTYSMQLVSRYIWTWVQRREMKQKRKKISMPEHVRKEKYLHKSLAGRWKIVSRRFILWRGNKERSTHLTWIMM